jgi:HAD superfamily phosphoserine phosphatase-like hydrolase
MPKNLVVFDFCDTLTNFQTAGAYIKFVLKDRPRSFGALFYKFVGSLERLSFFVLVSKFYPQKNIAKRFKLLSLRGMSKHILDEYAKAFFHQVIRQNYNPTVIEKLRAAVLNEDHVVLSSGGYDLYLKYFCQEEGITYFTCTKVGFNGEKCTGRFDGKDCMNEQKVAEIEMLIERHCLVYEKKIVYSDSKSDLPLFVWADEGFVISKNRSQEWAKKLGYNEIIVNI